MCVHYMYINNHEKHDMSSYFWILEIFSAVAIGLRDWSLIIVGGGLVEMGGGSTKIERKLRGGSTKNIIDYRGRVHIFYLKLISVGF